MKRAQWGWLAVLCFGCNFWNALWAMSSGCFAVNMAISCSLAVVLYVAIRKWRKS
jgi:hypothetical protein